MVRPSLAQEETDPRQRLDRFQEIDSVQNDFTNQDLSDIRDAVPHLDLAAIRALRRAGFDIVRREAAPAPPQIHNFWNQIPRPMKTAALEAAG